MKQSSKSKTGPLCFLIILGVLPLMQCAKSSDSSTASTTTTTQTCRIYPKNLTDTTNTTTYNCTFNGSTTVTCTDGGAETMTYTYPSLQKFVNQAATPVSVFNKTGWSTLVIGSATAARQHNLTFTYNGSDQLTSIVQVSGAGGGFTITWTFTAWDTNNRPTTGTAAFTAGALVCTGRVVAVTYVDGTTRSQTWGTSAGTGANCSSLNASTTIQDANAIATQAFSNNYTINTTSTQCY